MYTAVVLMCTIDMWCYNLVYENGFFRTREECESSIQELVKSEDFDPLYRFFEEGVTYNVYNTVCINWEAVNI